MDLDILPDNSTISLDCDDSRLSVAASVTGILTFSYAVLTGFYFSFYLSRDLRDAGDELSRKAELIAKALQQAIDSKIRERTTDSSDLRSRAFQEMEMFLLDVVGEFAPLLSRQFWAGQDIDVWRRRGTIQAEWKDVVDEMGHIQYSVRDHRWRRLWMSLVYLWRRQEITEATAQLERQCQLLDDVL